MSRNRVHYLKLYGVVKFSILAIKSACEESKVLQSSMIVSIEVPCMYDLPNPVKMMLYNR
jgi:hypothetical protein